MVQLEWSFHSRALFACSADFHVRLDLLVRRQAAGLHQTLELQ
jgi:hypothetical protein